MGNEGSRAERKSSVSNSQGTCLWVGVVNPLDLSTARLAGAAGGRVSHFIGIRNDTDWLADPVLDDEGKIWLCATPDEWDAFIAAAKRGEFDLLPHTRLLPALEIAAPLPVPEPGEVVDDRIPGEVTLDAALDHKVSPLEATDGEWRCSCGQLFRSDSGFAVCPDAPPVEGDLVVGVRPVVVPDPPYADDTGNA